MKGCINFSSVRVLGDTKIKGTKQNVLALEILKRLNGPTPILMYTRNISLGSKGKNTIRFVLIYNLFLMVLKV